METYALLIAATLNAGTVLAIASLGLLINEKAGIVNLGAEGMMLCAAIAGFAAVVHTGSDTLGFAAGMLAGAVMAAIFGAELVWRRILGLCRGELRARKNARAAELCNSWPVGHPVSGFGAVQTPSAGVLDGAVCRRYGVVAVPYPRRLSAAQRG